MNNTFDSIAALNRAEKAASSAAINRLASVDTASAALPVGTPTHGELTLTTAFKPAMTLPPYYLSHTRAAMGITLVMTAVTVALPLVFAPSAALIPYSCPSWPSASAADLSQIFPPPMSAI